MKQLANGSFLSRRRRDAELRTALEEHASHLCVHTGRLGASELALQGRHFFQHIVAADYIIFRAILIVSNNCCHVKVTLEVLGKWSLCWLHFPQTGYLMVRANLRCGFVRLVKLAWSSVSLLRHPPDLYGPVIVPGMRAFMCGCSLLVGRVEAVGIFRDMCTWLCLPRTCQLITVFTCK